MQEKAEPFGSAFVRFYNILILYLNRLAGVERIRNRVGNEGCLGAVVNGQLGLAVLLDAVDEVHHFEQVRLCETLREVLDDLLTGTVLIVNHYTVLPRYTGNADFGLGVVAVRRSTANVQESNRTIVKLEHCHAGLGVTVLGKLGVLEVGACGVNLSNLTAEEPAHQVNVVRSRVNEDAARGLGELDAALDQCFRVKAGSLYQMRPALICAFASA